MPHEILGSKVRSNPTSRQKESTPNASIDWILIGPSLSSDDIKDEKWQEVLFGAGDIFQT